MLGWDELRACLERGDFPADKLRVTRDRHALPAILFTDEGKVSGAKLSRLLESGVSLIAEPLQPHVPALRVLADEIAARIPEKIKIGAIATTGAGGAFAPHYDPEDLIILQLQGSKRWTIHAPSVVHPVRGLAPPPPRGAAAFDDVLRPGDFLFVPAGHWHACENDADLSLHLGIFFRPPTAWHALSALAARLLAEEVFRRPLTRFANAAERAEYEAMVRERLREAVAEMPLTDDP
ncbi:MAG: cupin domain-containing protein [Rhizomicrobium sp.]